jgi:predicted nucleic-acid-binding Zn-ribbon protein
MSNLMVALTVVVLITLLIPRRVGRFVAWLVVKLGGGKTVARVADAIPDAVVIPNDGKVRCPKCGSDQISGGTKGFGAGKAVAGAVATGGIGLLFGFAGSKKVVVNCLKCGNSWEAGQK